MTKHNVFLPYVLNFKLPLSDNDYDDEDLDVKILENNVQCNKAQAAAG